MANPRQNMLRGIIGVIDSINELSGKVVCWISLVLIFTLCYEVVVRYVFNAPTIWSFDSTRMLVCTIGAMGWAYTHLHHGHVRVDVLYVRLSLRGRAIIDVAGAFLFFFPVVIGLMWVATTNMWYSWSVGETWVTTYWEPIVGPIRTAMLLGLFLFMMQGMAQLIRDLYLMVRGKTL